jgi:hypothetical protein
VSEQDISTGSTRAICRVFISYSHEDKKWHDDLDKHLKPYLRDGSITSWSDEKIVPGSKWFGEIKSALAQTRVTVLLVSSDFLTSDLESGRFPGVRFRTAPVGLGKLLACLNLPYRPLRSINFA